MNIVQNRKIFYSISSVLIIASFAALFVWGLNFGIDFKGGSLVEVEYVDERPEISVLQQSLSNIQTGELSIRPTGEKGYIVRTKELTENDRSSFIKAFGPADSFEVKRSDSVGPVLGKELQIKASFSIALVLIAIILFITFVFRKVSAPVASWKYGVTAIVALAHDVIIPVGVFAVLGQFYGTEIDSLFITALLVVLGFSIHDSIVVFDRVREHLRDLAEEKIKNKNAVDEPFEITVEKSVQETLSRSINTSLTTLLALVALYIFGPEATKNFSLALFVGITAGTYSSIFLGSTLLVTLEKWQNKNKK